MRRRLLTVSFPWIMFSLVGCGGDEGVSDITGTIVDTHVTDTGDIQRKHNASTASVAVKVLGDGGNFTRIEGEVADDGTFVIADVPQGPHYLECTRTLVGNTEPTRYDLVTSERSLDLGIITAGRPDAAILKSSTPLDVMIDGLQQSMQTTDEVWLSSLGAGLACSFTDVALTTDFDNCGSRVFAIDSTQGDRTFVTHLGTHEEPAGEFYISMDNVFEAASFTVVDGEQASLSGTFSSVPQETLTISMNTPAFVSTAADVHPNATARSFTLSVRATSGRTLLHYSSLNLDALLTSFQYGNPFPSESERYFADVGYGVTFPVPGMALSVNASVSIGRSGPASSLSATTFEPSMSPPHDIRINGQPAAEGLSGVGTTPTISWSAPSKGTAAGYDVFMLKFDPTNSDRVVGGDVISTAETSLTWRPGFLKPGGYYCVRIRATSSFNPKAPFKHADGEQAYAEGLTGVITP